MKIDLFAQYPELIPQKAALINAKGILIDTFTDNAKLLLCGNGGSAADCDHIAGELLKGFLNKRRLEGTFYSELGALSEKLQWGLPAISLPAQGAVISAYCNDVDADAVYAQLTLAFGRKGDTLLCISTSGKSKNVVQAAKVAKALGLNVLALVGQNECALDALADVTVHAPADQTYRVQEYHLPIYHWLCAEVERHFFGE